MSFALGFYRFNIDLSHQAHALYEHVIVRTPLHPLESIEDLLLRVIVYCHAYRNGLQLSAGQFEQHLPTAWRESVTAGLDQAIMLGNPDRKLFDRLAREVPARAKECEYRIYFANDEQRATFCKHLRSSRVNWVQAVKFMQIGACSLEALAAQTKSSSRWNVTIVDETLWLSSAEAEIEMTIKELDIWSEYQDSLIATPNPSSRRDL